MNTPNKHCPSEASRTLARRPESRLGESADDAPADSARAYVAPALTVLGSLAELTLGGTDEPISDGFGGAGDIGSI